MEDATGAACRAVFTLFPQNGQRIVRRASGVNHQRLVELASCLDVGAKAVALPLHVSYAALAETEIVQPGFSNADHAWQLAQTQQILQRRFGDVLVVGMDPNRGPKILILRRQSVNR